MKSTAIVLALILCAVAYAVAVPPTPASAPKTYMIESVQFGNHLGFNEHDEIVCVPGGAKGGGAKPEAQWNIHWKYNGIDTVAFESVKKPGWFIVISGQRVALKKAPDKPDPAFTAAATFKKLPGVKSTMIDTVLEKFFSLSPAVAQDSLLITRLNYYQPKLDKITAKSSESDKYGCNMFLVEVP